MATIVTVHGTSDTGPEAGDKWWQSGGPLHEDLKRWVGVDDGELRFKPVLWNGLNSEAARYNSSVALADALTQLEAEAQPYCVIGHSHGGSNMIQALALMCQRSTALSHLRSWITVGTPFIEFKPRRLLFSRLTPTGVAAYLILFYIFVMWLAFVASSIFLVTGENAPGLQNPDFDIPIIVIAAAVMLVLYFLLRRLQPAKLRMNNAPFRARVANTIAGRWLGLWHSDDEVIAGGRVLKDINFRPFRSDFASPIFAFLSLLLIPVILYVVSSANLYTVLTDRLDDWMVFRPSPNPDDLKNFARNSLAIVTLPAIGLFELYKWIEFLPTDSANTNRAIAFATLVAGGLVGLAAIWLLGLLLHRVVLVSSHFVSAGASRWLNALTRSEVVALGYGSDSHGEDAVGAQPYPAGFPVRCACLPAALEADISRSSDEAASATLSKMRAALSAMTVEGDGNPADLLMRHMTWSELVHTNYFRVPRLRKLLAYIVAQQPGFHATEAFRADPEYALMGQWLAEIEVGKAGSAVTPQRGAVAA